MLYHQKSASVIVKERPFCTILESSTGSSSSETCDDGIQNQNEKGIDCGGPCPYCQGSLQFNYFEMILF